MPHVTHNLCVKTGEYESAGQKKGRYLRIGRMMDGENGPFILLDAAFVSMQLFALCNKDRRDSIIVSLFTEDGREKAAGHAKAAEAGHSGGDDIPF